MQQPIEGNRIIRYFFSMNFALSRNQTQWFINYARIGYASKGVVYCITGILAILAAMGNGSASDTGRTNVLNKILEQPFGGILLGIVGIGMFGYVLWRLVEAIKDPHDHGTDLNGVLVRTGYFFSAIVYLGLSYYALRAVFFGVIKNSSGDSQRTLIDKVLDLPMGQWIVGAIALIIFIRGCIQAYKGISGKYKKNLKEYEISPDYRDVVVKAGAVGSVARGIVWCLIAFLFLKAALNHNANEVGGTENALKFIASDFGLISLGAIGFGLICYGAFKILQALYLRMKVS